MLAQHNELYEALENLLELVQNKEDDVFFQSNMEAIKDTYHMHNEDPVIKIVLNTLTRFCAKLVLWELKEIPTEAEIHYFKSGTSECSCPHFCSYVLPCRHIFQLRRQSGKKDVVTF